MTFGQIRAISTVLTLKEFQVGLKWVVKALLVKGDPVTTTWAKDFPVTFF